MNIRIIIGIILIIVGIGTLAYRGIHYTTEDKVAQIGSLKVTAEDQKTVYFPPALGGISLAAGIVLVILGTRRSK